MATARRSGLRRGFGKQETVLLCFRMDRPRRLKISRYCCASQVRVIRSNKIGILGQIRIMGVQSLRTVIDRILMWSLGKYGFVLGVVARHYVLCNICLC